MLTGEGVFVPSPFTHKQDIQMAGEIDIAKLPAEQMTQVTATEVIPRINDLIARVQELENKLAATPAKAAPVKTVTKKATTVKGK